MYDGFATLLNMSLSAGILVIVVLFLRFFLKKVPKKYICILWALVALRLLCPFSVSSGLSAFNLLNAERRSSSQVEFFQYNGKSEKPKLEFEVPVLVNDDQLQNRVTVEKHFSDLYFLTVMLVWFFGVLSMSGYALYGYVRLRKEVSASIPRKDNIYICDGLKSPFILGIIKPRIYLPSGMDETTNQYVIAHETAHLQRRDHWWKPFGYAILTVYWFHPFLWVGYKLFCQDIEAACDEKVIEGMDREAKAYYSQALLTCAINRRRITACPIAFGETDVKNRVKNVLHYKKPALWITVFMIVICIIFAICFLTAPKKVEDVKTSADDGNILGIDIDESETPSMHSLCYHVVDAFEADIDHDGKAEMFMIRDDEYSLGCVEIYRDDEETFSIQPFWSRDFSTSHAGNGILFLTNEDNEDYLVGVSLYVGQGFYTYSYQVFFVEGNSEIIIEENSYESENTPPDTKEMLDNIKKWVNGSSRLIYAADIDGFDSILYSMDDINGLLNELAQKKEGFANDF